MKLRTMKVLTPLAAFALTLGLEAGTSLTTEGFESYTAGDGITSGQNNFLFVPPSGETVADQSKVTAYADDAMPGAEVGANYLKLSTEDGKLFRSINALNDGALGEAVKPKAEGIDIDAVMQFTATDSNDRPDGAGEKFVMWLDANTSGETPEYSLMVLGGKYTYANGALSLVGNAIYKLSGENVAPGSWHRVTVKAFPTVNGEVTPIPGFQILIDGAPVTAERVLRSTEGAEGGIFDEAGYNAQDAVGGIVAAGLADGTYIPSMSSDASLQAVGFAGEGKVDNLAVTDNYVAPTVTFGITVPAGVEIVSVTDTATSKVIEPDEAGKYTADPAAPLAVVVGLPAGKLFDDGSKTKTLSLTAAADTVASGIDAESIKDAAAKIGEDEFLDIGAAYNAAVAAKGGTITLLQNIESGVLKWKAADFTSDFTVDLGGKTVTFDCADSKYAIQITQGTPTVTFKNGKIAAKASAEGKSLTTVFQNYANLVVEDVEIDADYFNGTANPYTDKPGMIFAVMNGTLAITGNTSVKNCHGWVLSVGNHASTDYVSRAVTLNTTGTLAGDFRFCGGTVTYVACGFADDAKFYYGAACAKIVEGSPVGSTYVDGDLVGFPFVARAGGEPAMPAVEATYSYAGQFYRTADAAFAAVDGATTVGIIADCEFSGSYVFTSDVTIKVVSNITLTRTGAANYPFKVEGDATLTFNGDGTILKAADCGSSTMVSVGSDDNFAIDSGKAGHVVIADCGIKLVDMGGSNTISIDCGSFVMNGGYVENGRDGGHAVRVSSTIADGSAALVTVNKGQLKAVSSPLGVKTKTGGEVTITQLADGWARINYDDSSNHYAGKIKVALDAGENLLFSNALSEFAPVGYEYVTSETDGWYKIGMKTYKVTITDGDTASGTATPATFKVSDTFPLAVTLVQPEAPSGKKFASWSANFGTITDGVLTLTEFPNADVVVTVVWQDVASDIEVAPGATTTDPFDTQAAAEAAMAKVAIVPAEAVATGLSAEDLETYKGKFEKRVVAVGDKFAIAVALSSAAEAELQTQANNDAKVLDPAAAAAAEVEAEAEIATIPGFYYSLKAGAALNSMVEGDRTLATKGTLKLKVPNKGATGFYQVLINIGPKVAE